MQIPIRIGALIQRHIAEYPTVSAKCPANGGAMIVAASKPIKYVLEAEPRRSSGTDFKQSDCNAGWTVP